MQFRNGCISRPKSLGYPQQNVLTRGVTLTEVLVTIVVVGVLAAIAAPNVTKLGSKPLPDTVNQVAGLFRSARSKAIAQTLPIKIKPSGRLAVPSGTSTGGNNYQLEVWKPDPTQAVSTYSLSCNSETGWVLDSALTQQYATSSQSKLTFPLSSAYPYSPLITLLSTKVDSTVLSSPTSWEICFNPRGIASVTSVDTNIFKGNNVVLTFQQTSDSTTQRLEIFPAGGIQIYAN